MPLEFDRVLPLLTIAIPTWNRAQYLMRNLTQLRSELLNVQPGIVEVIVSDNHSSDSTPGVVQEAVSQGLPVLYVRNERNVGWASNFIQCFEMARGRYVLLLGDDDLFVDGTLAELVHFLSGRHYGVVCLRPYGFDTDPRRERPWRYGRTLVYSDSRLFLKKISNYFTLTSACVINKSLLAEVNSRQFITTDLATFHLVLRAALAAETNIFIDRYLIASKRQNSSSYEYADVFVDQFWEIMDAHIPYGLDEGAIRAIERKKILSYYPFYLFDLRLSGKGNPQQTLDRFRARFEDSWLFVLWLCPIMKFPRPFGLAWGAMTTIMGRVLGGDLLRGLWFAWNRFRGKAFS